MHISMYFLHLVPPFDNLGEQPRNTARCVLQSHSGVLSFWIKPRIQLGHTFQFLGGVVRGYETIEMYYVPENESRHGFLDSPFVFCFFLLFGDGVMISVCKETSIII